MNDVLGTRSWENFQDILNGAVGLAEELKPLQQFVLANLILLGETPAPTFGEERRMQLLINRFSEVGLQNVENDDKSNIFGVLHGSEGKRNIAVSAHMDTVYPDSTDHTISVQPGLVTGAGVADNSLSGLRWSLLFPTCSRPPNIRLKTTFIPIGKPYRYGHLQVKGDFRSSLGTDNNMPVISWVCVE